MSVAKHIPDNIKRVSRSLGYALWLNTSDAWVGFAVVLSARLTSHQRAALAYAALRSLDDETAYKTASAALFGTFDADAVPGPFDRKAAA